MVPEANGKGMLQFRAESATWPISRAFNEPATRTVGAVMRV